MLNFHVLPDTASSQHFAEVSSDNAIRQRRVQSPVPVGPACRAGLRGHAATSDESRSKERPRGDVERMCDPWRFAMRRKSFPAGAQTCLTPEACQAVAFRVVANVAGAAIGEPLGVSPRCAAIPLAAVGDIVVCLEVQPGAARHASLLRLSTQTNLHAVENGERN